MTCADLRSDVAALAHAIRTLEQGDAIALPWLDMQTCQSLREAAGALPFRKARPIVGETERAVFQDFDICMAIPVDHPLHALRRASEAALQSALAAITPAPLAGPFRLNDLVVQRYPAGSAGISPHKDHVRYTGLVAIVLLAGDGVFSVCAERSGAGDRPIAAQPGDLILMRAPGLFDRRDRPFHRLRDITIERLTVGLRHDSTSPETDGASA